MYGFPFYAVDIFSTLKIISEIYINRITWALLELGSTNMKYKNVCSNNIYAQQYYTYINKSFLSGTL